MLTNPSYIQFTPVGTPDPPISLLLTASFKCPTDITNVRYPKPGPHPPLIPNVLRQVFPGSGRGSSIFPVAQAKPVDSSPSLVSHVQPAHHGISLLCRHPWNMVGLTLSSLLPGPSSVHCQHSSPAPHAFLITWNMLCMFLTYPAYLFSPTEGMLHESKTFSLFHFLLCPST